MAILSGAAEKQLVFFFSFWIGLFYLLLIIFVCTSKRKGSRLLRVKNGGWWSGQSRLPSGPSKSFEKIKNKAAGEFSRVFICLFLRRVQIWFVLFWSAPIVCLGAQFAQLPQQGTSIVAGCANCARVNDFTRTGRCEFREFHLFFFCCVQAAGNEHKRSVWLPLCSDNFRQFYLHFIIFSHSNFITKFVEIF